MTRAKAAIVGVGHSRLLRRDDVPLGVLAVEAVTTAVEDAGLKLTDIDGLSTTPYQPFEGGGEIDGISLVTPEFVMEALGLDFSWSERQLQPVGASLINAIHAVAAGQCRYAVCFRAMHNPAGRPYGFTAPEGTSAAPSEPHHQGAATQFNTPYGVFPPGKFALLATAHMARYGSTREQLGQFVVRNRDEALKWEHGYWYQYAPQKLTLEAYLGSRMISSPLCLYDCDLPVQMAGAFVITSEERARDLRHPPAYVIGTSNPASLHQLAPQSLDGYMSRGRHLARRLWENAGIGPNDVDVANLYDGFSVHTPLWAEALGFCGEGEGFEFVASPSLPLNTSSGNLGGGRTHGIGQIMDTVLQVQRRAGQRQVDGAEVCVSVTQPCDSASGIVLASSPN